MGVHVIVIRYFAYKGSKKNQNDKFFLLYFGISLVLHYLCK